MTENTELDNSTHYERIKEKKQAVIGSEQELFFSDTGLYSSQKKTVRGAKKRADLQATIKERSETFVEPAGSVWACCLGSSILFEDLLKCSKKGIALNPLVLKIENTHSEVFFCKCFQGRKTCFVFRFGCIVAWDVGKQERDELIAVLKPFVSEPLGAKSEDDMMSFVWSDRSAIRADIVHLVSSNIFERLAYSYAFSQSVKLAVFETVVDESIERTRKIPEGLAKSGTIHSTREEIGRQIGELFVNRFYINLHTDILDTPDIFWDNDDYADHYDHCRRYLEIPKRVDILNQRLDIIKDLYDMLNNELTIQHGYKLEWIVIYLICIEVLIDVVWNILIKGILHWF